jgi:hypothetical protein
MDYGSIRSLLTNSSFFDFKRIESALNWDITFYVLVT